MSAFTHLRAPWKSHRFTNPYPLDSLPSGSDGSGARETDITATVPLSEKREASSCSVSSGGKWKTNKEKPLFLLPYWLSISRSCEGVVRCGLESSERGSEEATKAAAEAEEAADEGEEANEEEEEEKPPKEAELKPDWPPKRPFPLEFRLPNCEESKEDPVEAEEDEENPSRLYCEAEPSEDMYRLARGSAEKGKALEGEEPGTNDEEKSESPSEESPFTLTLSDEKGDDKESPLPGLTPAKCCSNSSLDCEIGCCCWLAKGSRLRLESDRLAPSSALLPLFLPSPRMEECCRSAWLWKESLRNSLANFTMSGSPPSYSTLPCRFSMHFLAAEEESICTKPIPLLMPEVRSHRILASRTKP